MLCIPPSVSKLESLRTLRCGFNDLDDNAIDKALHALPDLTTLDLSNNQLQILPEYTSDGLLVLSLAHNQIQEISRSVLRDRLVAIEYLDLSHNKLTGIEPQLRRLQNIKCLVLSGNPLRSDDRIRSVFSLEELVRLEISDIGRTNSNLYSMEDLVNLREMDASHNGFMRFPEEMLDLKSLQRLQLNDNNITTVCPEISKLSCLETLNLSRNSLESIPVSHLSVHYSSNLGTQDEVVQLPKLRNLYLNSNRLKTLPSCTYTTTLVSTRTVVEHVSRFLNTTCRSCCRLETINLRRFPRMCSSTRRW